MKIEKVLILILSGTIVALIFLFSTPEPLSEKDALQVIHERKSVYHFQDSAVPVLKLVQLVRAGMAAPTAKNAQPWSFIIINRRSLLDSLADVLSNAVLKRAPAAIVVCGDETAAHLSYSGASYWLLDCSAASQNILLAAEALGLGAVWMALYPEQDMAFAVQGVLNIPPTITPLNIVPIGYPKGIETPKNKWDTTKLYYNHWNTRKGLILSD